MTSSYIIVANKLKKKTKNWKNIMDVLDENTVLCGGFILSILTGDNWDTDIDILTTNRDLTNLGTGEWVKDNVGNYRKIKCVQTIYKGSYVGCKIHIIHTNNIEESVKDFDFDFCKCWFDGKDFHILNPDSFLL